MALAAPTAPSLKNLLPRVPTFSRAETTERVDQPVELFIPPEDEATYLTIISHELTALRADKRTFDLLIDLYNEGANSPFGFDLMESETFLNHCHEQLNQIEGLEDYCIAHKVSLDQLVELKAVLFSHVLTLSLDGEYLSHLGDPGERILASIEHASKGINILTESTRLETFAEENCVDDFVGPLVQDCYEVLGKSFGTLSNLQKAVLLFVVATIGAAGAVSVFADSGKIKSPNDNNDSKYLLSPFSQQECGGGEHTVVAGNTLLGIARNALGLGIGEDESAVVAYKNQIVATNGLQDENVLSIGQRLILPTVSCSTPANPSSPDSPLQSETTQSIGRRIDGCALATLPVHTFEEIDSEAALNIQAEQLIKALESSHCFELPTEFRNGLVAKISEAMYSVSWDGLNNVEQTQEILRIIGDSLLAQILSFGNINIQIDGKIPGYWDTYSPDPSLDDQYMFANDFFRIAYFACIIKGDNTVDARATALSVATKDVKELIRLGFEEKGLPSVVYIFPFAALVALGVFLAIKNQSGTLPTISEIKQRFQPQPSPTPPTPSSTQRKKPQRFSSARPYQRR